MMKEMKNLLGGVYEQEGKNGRYQLIGHHIDQSDKKVLVKKSQNSHSQLLHNEIAILRRVTHPNIQRYIDSFEENDQVYLVKEFAATELSDEIIERQMLTERESFHYFKQLIDTLEYCHHRLIIHGNLSIDSCLLDEEHNLKLDGFGSIVVKSPSEIKNYLYEYCDSVCHHFAPEVITNSRPVSSGIDIWSAGVILFTLLHGRFPFDDENLHCLFKSIRAGDFQASNSLSIECIDLLKRMMCPDPDSRITMSQIKIHPWWWSQDMTHRSIFRVMFSSLRSKIYSDVEIQCD